MTPSSELVLPDVNDEVAGPFWAGCREGLLRIQACAACGRRRMPPRPMCPACQSLDARWDAVAGTGTVWSYAVPHPPLLPAYAERAPYAVVVITLDDDPSIRLVGDCVEGTDPQSLSIGDPMQVAFERVADDVWLPRWAPHVAQVPG
jgi:uncharacterized OB-fold protein